MQNKYFFSVREDEESVDLCATLVHCTMGYRWVATISDSRSLNPILQVHEGGMGFHALKEIMRIWKDKRDYILVSGTSTIIGEIYTLESLRA